MRNFTILFTASLLATITVTAGAADKYDNRNPSTGTTATQPKDSNAQTSCKYGGRSYPKDVSTCIDGSMTKCTSEGWKDQHQPCSK
jgi:hypothetical protein